MKFSNAPMTNHPHDLGPYREDMTAIEWFRHLILAISLATWDPRYWATHHDIAFDLPSAWWLASFVEEDCAGDDLT